MSVGSETTATTLSWAVLYMILYPQVQEKIHKEIDEVLDDNEPSLEDRVRCIIYSLFDFYDQKLIFNHYVIFFISN